MRVVIVDDEEPARMAVEGGQTRDFKFVGDVERSSTVRSSGMKELLALRNAGVNVDIPETRLPPEEFYADSFTSEADKHGKSA